MCWNVEFSAFSAVWGWIVCAYLWRRGYSPRDKWYATYLVTYTFTQLVDIYLWMTHESMADGLKGCPELKESFGGAPKDEAQYLQFVVSKYFIPVVVFSQFFVQLQYPSKLMEGKRYWMIAAHSLACIGMCFGFACTDVVQSRFPKAHDTLRWGGHSAQTWEVLVVVAVVCIDFHLTMPEIQVKLAHICVFLSVVSFIYFTEGTLAVGSKWCTYCLIFSVVYASDPLWGPGPSPVHGGVKSVRNDPLAQRKAYKGG